jgi:predicted ATPase
MASVRCLAARQLPDVEIYVELGDDDIPAFWTYQLRFQSDGTKNRLPIIVEEIAKLNEADEVLRRPDKSDKTDTARLGQTALEQTSANKDFREIAEFFASVRYLHVVPQFIREPSRALSREDSFGADLIARINGTPKKTREARLRRMNEALKIAIPQLDGLELVVDEIGTPHLRAKYQHWRGHGAWQQEDRFSDGTLRLLGFIWALQTGGGPLLLEEPEQSLNPFVVTQLAPMISRATRRSRRQTFVTTHSVELLSQDVSLDEINLLSPSENGTTVQPVNSIDQVRELVAGGISPGEAVLARTQPREARSLPLLDLMS